MPRPIRAVPLGVAVQRVAAPQVPLARPDRRDLAAPEPAPQARPALEAAESAGPAVAAGQADTPAQTVMPARAERPALGVPAVEAVPAVKAVPGAAVSAAWPARGAACAAVAPA